MAIASESAATADPRRQPAHEIEHNLIPTDSLLVQIRDGVPELHHFRGFVHLLQRRGVQIVQQRDERLAADPRHGIADDTKHLGTVGIHQQIQGRCEFAVIPAVHIDVHAGAVHRLEGLGPIYRKVGLERRSRKVDPGRIGRGDRDVAVRRTEDDPCLARRYRVVSGRQIREAVGAASAGRHRRTGIPAKVYHRAATC